MRFPNIDAERARKGLSKEELAKALGVSYRAYYKWMRRGTIPVSAAKKMAELFGVTIEYLSVKEESA